MRILFFSHYFPPEVNAPATRTYDHCVRWVKAGHEVTVVTSAPNCPDGVLYAGYKNPVRSQREDVAGIHVVRVWTHVAPNAYRVRRTLNYLSYMLSAAWTAMWLPRPDVVVATSPQFFCGWAGVFASRWKRVPLVLEIRDIWPDSIEAVGALGRGLALRLLQSLERGMYRAARHIVTVGEGYRANIVTKVDADKPITVITNGVDLQRFIPAAPDGGFLREWGLEGKFVCSYVGTIGMAHGLEVVVEAARLLRQQGRDDICFCLVGDGAARLPLQRSVAEAGLAGRVVFCGRQPKERIPAILSSSDACLIHLRNCELFNSVLPSKIFETMAMGRPMILGVRGEGRDIALAAGAGLEMEPDSAPSLVQAVQRLADDRPLTQSLGQRARQYVACGYDREQLALRYAQLLEEIARGNSLS